MTNTSTASACEICGKSNPADIHTCTPTSMTDLKTPSADRKNEILDILEKAIVDYLIKFMAKAGQKITTAEAETMFSNICTNRVIKTQFPIKQ